MYLLSRIKYRTHVHSSRLSGDRKGSHATAPNRKEACHVIFVLITGSVEYSLYIVNINCYTTGNQHAGNITQNTTQNTNLRAVPEKIRACAAIVFFRGRWNTAHFYFRGFGHHSGSHCSLYIRGFVCCQKLKVDQLRALWFWHSAVLCEKKQHYRDCGNKTASPGTVILKQLWGLWY